MRTATATNAPTAPITHSPPRVHPVHLSPQTTPTAATARAWSEISDKSDLPPPVLQLQYPIAEQAWIPESDVQLRSAVRECTQIDELRRQQNYVYHRDLGESESGHIE